jgi:polysaccharide deacetylase family protein (PEP-CTERM system associated)
LSRENDTPRIAFSVDVEPWWASDLIPKGMYEGHEDIVLPAVEELLLLMKRKGAYATFFVLGEIAEKHPEMVEEIARQGHEVGSHGYDHTNLYQLTPDDFLTRERKVIEILRSIVGTRPIGFRAPSFSIGRETSWIFEVLEKDLGYRYSSSVFPVHTPLYGYPGAPLQPHHPNQAAGDGESTGENGLVEFPLTVYRKLRISLPICGGGYLRFQPVWLVSSLLKRVIAERPAVINIHPRDVYSLDKIPREINLVSRIGLFYGVDKTLAKLERLMDNFTFKPIREVLSL